MISLYKIILNELSSMGFQPTELSSKLKNPDKCIEIINEILRRHDKADCFISSSEAYKTTKGRALHILATYSLGSFLFRNFKEIFHDILCNSILYENYDDILFAWMVASLFHDIGYYRKSFYTEKTIARLVKNFYEGASFKPTYSSYTVINYYLMKKEGYVDPYELFDHGIVGSIYTWNSLNLKYKKEIKNKKLDPYFDGFVNRETMIQYLPSDLEKIKDACTAICQHNIFKSSSSSSYYYECFELYELLDSNIRITAHDLLTFVLSIVDTIDCSKRYNQNITDFCNNLFVEPSGNSILISYDNSNIFEDKKLFNKDKYYNDLCNLKKWVDVETNKNNEGVEIKLWK